MLQRHHADTAGNEYTLQSALVSNRWPRLRGHEEATWDKSTRIDATARCIHGDLTTEMVTVSCTPSHIWIPPAAGVMFKLPKGAFAPLELSKDTQTDIERQVERVVAQTVRDSEQFFASGKNLPPKQWKHIKTKENVHVYRERNVRAKKLQGRSYSATHSSSSSSGMSTTAEEHEELEQTLVEKPAHVPTLLYHGLVSGTLDDMMYGIFADDDASWQFKTTYMEDPLDDAKILTKIHGPSEADPFRCMAVKWFVRQHPAVIGTLMQRRDFLVVDASGTTVDSQGRRVGYYLVHSIRFSQIQELRLLGLMRADVALCFVLRQDTPTIVQLYCQGFSDPRGDLNMSLYTMLVADNLCSSVNLLECGYLKKLLWLVRKKRPMSQEQRLGTASTKADHCSSCHRGINKLFHSGSACLLCNYVSTYA